MNQLLPYEKDDAETWDELVDRSITGSFLHSRRFLAYHGARFADRSLMWRNRRTCPVAVFPAAEDPSDRSVIISHPGITYGGLIHAGDLRGAELLGVMESVRDHYAKLGYLALRYKALPVIYRRRPSDDDLYALHRLGAVLYRRDLSCAVELSDRAPVAMRRKRGFRRAQSAGVVIKEGIAPLSLFWKVLEANLATRHQVTPVHTEQEIIWLRDRFPQSIQLVCAILEDQIVAGVVLFDTHTVSHAQYIASNSLGREVCALDAIFEWAIERALGAGKRYFDFGISNEQEGQVLNDSLYSFKAEFGGGGIAHDFYHLTLAA